MPGLVRALTAIVAAALITVALPTISAHAQQTVVIFDSNMVHFSETDSMKFARGNVVSIDRGRVISTTVDLPRFTAPTRITGHLIVIPTPKDELEMFDRWDRAGNVRLEVEGGPDIELVKFITAYGGRTEYHVDLSPLALLLQGKRTLNAFVDTWVTPAWSITFALIYSPDTTARNADWVAPVLFDESYTRENPGDSGRTAVVNIPDALHRVLLRYFVSGHCTDGMGADEFEQKDNVLYVDGRVVYRYRPWRDDCRQFRPINPYCRRWTDGSWSCDYSRSGWCPGDIVTPLEFDLSDHLTPGEHTMRIVVENVRPKDDKGQYGYWRISTQLLGFK